MRIALLSCGPSLKLYEGCGYDVVIGVNRAVTAYACDWWSFCDWQTFGMFKPIGQPAIFTDRPCYESVCRHYGSQQHTYFFKHNDVKRKPDARWSCYSATAALILASNLDARSIDCFGCDMHGVCDFDGTTPEYVNRDSKRWADELAIWRQIVEWINQSGCTVRRVGFDGHT